jgi:hypothetical protein
MSISIWGDTLGLQYVALLLKKNLIGPLKAKIFENSHSQYKKNPPLPPTDDGDRPRIYGKSLWQAADQQKKPVCIFLLISPVGISPEVKN